MTNHLCASEFDRRTEPEVGLRRFWPLPSLLVCLLAVLILLLIQTPIRRDFPRTAIPYLLSLIVAVPGVLFLVCWRRSK